MIINGENLILGRLASVVAKKALMGEKIDVVNCEKVVISGKKAEILFQYKEKDQMTGELKGPYLPKMPDRLVRRTVRGMLPYKQDKGEKAFKRVMCYLSIPSKFKDQKLETIQEVSKENLKIANTITLQEICRLLKK